MGAKNVIAIDNDEWSINNAKENFIANNFTDIDLHQKDNLAGLETCDIILANINLNVIAANSNQIKLTSKQGAKLLLSGFLITDEQVLINNFTSEGFTQLATTQKNGWISILLTKS